MGKIEDEMNTKFADDKHKMLANIIFSAQWIKGRFSSFMDQYGLSSPQFNVLRILRGDGDWLNMNEMKSRMIEKSPNTTRLCDKLIEKDLIVRRRCDEDRRVVFLKISETGLKLLKKIDDENDGSHMAFMENLTKKEANELSDILDKLRG